MELKRCTKCGVEKEATREYFYYRSQLGQFMAQCKACTSDYNRKQHLANSEKRRRKAKENYAKNAEEKRKRNRERYASDPKKHIACQMKWQSTHRDAMRVIKQRKRAILRSATGSHTDADIRRQYEAQNGICYYCKCEVGGNYHVDHYIPLSRGGSNGPENLRIACPTCNHSKHNKLPHEWVR